MSEKFDKIEYNEKIDIYSAGMVMWEAWTFRQPFSEYDDEMEGKPVFVLEDRIKGGLRPSIPDGCPYGNVMKQV